VSGDVELEYSVQIGVGTKKVDYALLLEDRPAVFVEAKGCDTTLKDEHETQLRSYMRQVGVDWGVLTNGRVCRVFRRDTASQTPNEILLAAFELDDAPSNTLVLKALTKESIASGEAQSIAKHIEATHDAITILREQKPALVTDVSERIIDETGEAIAQPVEDATKSFVDDLIHTLESRSHTTTNTPTPDTPTPDTPDTTTEATPQPAGAANPDGRYQIVFQSDGEQVGVVAADSQADVMTAAVDYLIQSHELLDAISLPYIPGTGRGNRALLNDDPVHADGGEMRQAGETTQGVWVFTSLSAADKQRYFPELPEVVGLDCQFRGGW
jgi:hypothetical protein